MISEGIIGTTLSNAYDVAVGGVTKGRVNKVGKVSSPKLFPSIRYIAAKPNNTFTKNAPKSKTLVICQIAKFGTLSLHLIHRHFVKYSY